MLSNAAVIAAEEKIGYVFREKTLLNVALTHTSYANETGTPDNERLEFLGDAVLNFIVADRLFRQSKESEGDLSARRAGLVSRKPLCAAVERMGLLEYYQLGAGVKKDTNVSSKFKSNLFEAVLGAVYLDSGSLAAAVAFVENRLLRFASAGASDFKSLLQEYLQQGKDAWTYETGDAENGGFRSVLRVQGAEYVGYGRKKREAEQEAARAACKALGL